MKPEVALERLYSSPMASHISVELEVVVRLEGHGRMRDSPQGSGKTSHGKEGEGYWRQLPADRNRLLYCSSFGRNASRKNQSS
jgi:hypothetical protein